MKKLFKWLAYTVVLATFLVALVLAIAYWNRDTLLDALTTELNKGINGKIEAGKIDFTFLNHFPNFSITLRDVYLRDKHFPKYQQNFLMAKKIFVDVELFALLKKEILINSLSINDARVVVFTAKNGDTNLDVFKKTGLEENETSSSPVFLNLKEIDFENVSVFFSDSTKDKFLSFNFQKTIQNISPLESGYNISIQGRLHFDSLHFNARGGAFLVDKDVTGDLQLRSLPPHTLRIEQSSIHYKNNRIDVTGSIETQKEGNYSLRFSTAAINVVDGKQLLNARLNKTLSKFDINDRVAIDVAISGRSVQGFIPKVDLSFKTQHASLRYGTLDFTSLTLAGAFTNHVDSLKERNNKNSAVTITSFKTVMEKIPVEGSVTFRALDDPLMDLKFTSALTHQDVSKHLDNRFSIEKGKFSSKVSYRGKLAEYLDPTRTRYEGKLNGQLFAKDASLFYKPKKIRFDQIQLKCAFTEKIFTIQDLKLNINGSAVAIEGTMQNFIPFFIQPKNKGKVKLSIQSPDFDLTTLTAKREGPQNSRKQSDRNRKKVTDLLDVIYSRLEFDVDLQVEQLRFRKLTGRNFKGRVKLNENLLEANPISMDVAGGNMDLNFFLRRLYDPVSVMTVEAHVHHADIRQLFLNFNNFSQKTIHADNLEGQISADISFKADVDDDYRVVAPSMQGTLDCKITNGGLRNFEPMENMSNFLFKKRDFSDVQFAEMNSNFSITGTNMDISRMEIQSSVLSLFLEGRYSFTDSTSLSVQLPLSNLKKRHRDFTPKNIGTHAKAGPSVYLHVYRDKDINSKIKIDYDPFKKWAKN